MPLRVSNLRTPIDEPLEALPRRLARAIGVSEDALPAWRVVRKSLDIRDKKALQFVYNAEIDLSDDAVDAQTPGVKVEIIPEEVFSLPQVGSLPLKNRPVVLGSGPGGLLCAYFLAMAGYKPLVLERGTPVHERIRDVKTFDEGGKFEPESNYLFGEGGAGTFSDGKLTSRAVGPDVRRVMELFAECKGQQPGKPSILYYHRPHLGSNRLPAVVKAIRRKIEEMGGEVRFHTRVEDLFLKEGRVTGVGTSSGEIPTELVVLAPGHSARDTMEMLLRRGVPIVQKDFQFGVRVEHPQELVNRVQYGARPYEEVLGNADYTVVARGNTDVFSFCMCAGGYVIPSVSQEGYFCTNGMSLSKRDSYFANSGLVVTIPTSQFLGSDPLAGIRLQEIYEKKAFELGRGDYSCPVQRATDFVSGRVSKGAESSYPRKKLLVSLEEVLPPFVVQAVKAGLPKLNRMWRGKFMPDAVLVGPEARGSSPVRIVRDDVTRQSPGIMGLFPVGEGAGYAGGIVSAAVDGLRTAKAVISQYAPLQG